MLRDMFHRPHPLRLSEPMRSLVLLGLLGLLLFSITDLLPSLLKRLVRFLLHLLHLGASKLGTFDCLLMLLVLISCLLIALPSWVYEFRHVDDFDRHTIVIGMGISFLSNGRESVTPEEGNLVSSGNNEGRLDDHSGSNDVSARLISVSDGGGIEEPEHRADETPGPSTVISHGTDGLESVVQSVIVQWLRKHAILDNWETVFQNFDFEFDVRNHPLYVARLNQTIKNASTDLSRMLKTNPKLSLKELEVYCVPISWDSMKRMQFFGGLSDTLLSKKVPNQQDEPEDSLLGKLESMWRLFFNENWIDRIDREWIDSIDQGYRPRETDHGSIRGLFRFMRNRWHHSDEFQESRGLCVAQSFYNYFNEQFPNLLVLSYGVAYSLCTGQQWFKDYLPSETF